MKLARSAIVIPLAALLVALGAGAVFAATSPAAPAAQAIVDPAAPGTTPAPGATAKPVAPHLTSILDGLVTKGTITKDQETAIVDALVADRTAQRAERVQLRGFLADGVLTQAEINQLPADSPFRKLGALMTNGQITVPEIRALGRDLLRNLAGARGMGGRMMGGTQSPAPTTGG